MKTQHTISTAMIVLVFAAFVSIGLPDALFGTSWPDMRVEFGIPNRPCILEDPKHWS
ncbi:MAG: hypothetical protein M9934_01185 [Thermomicrobiales bacterium]|nr:hypothetical protein [Thermomicrobiales bacterium]